MGFKAGQARRQSLPEASACFGFMLIVASGVLARQAMFTFVPQGSRSAHLSVGPFPQHAVKPGTTVWADAEAAGIHGGAKERAPKTSKTRATLCMSLPWRAAELLGNHRRHRSAQADASSGPLPRGHRPYLLAFWRLAHPIFRSFRYGVAAGCC